MRVCRTTVVSLALAGSLGLAACGNDAPSIEGASSPVSPGASQAPATSQASSAAPESEESESSSPSESSSSESSETSSSSAGPEGDATLTPNGTTLKMGEEGIINVGSETDLKPVGIKPVSLEAAPDSVYASLSLKKTDGTVYFLKHEVRNVKTSGNILPNSINGLFFHPKLNASNEGKGKRLYDSTPECETSYDDVAPGKKVTSCLIYQIGGDPVSGVVYSGLGSQNITWTE